jgi:drug/metabolite transporter (DMT)-like permease
MQLGASGYLMLCCLFWAFSFPLMKALQSVGAAHAPGESTLFLAASLVAWRFTLSGAALALVLGKKLAGFRHLEVEQGLGLGVFGGVGLVLQVDGLAYVQGSTSAFLTQGYCVWIPLWFVLVSRRLPPLSLLLATGAVVTGAAILAGLGTSQLHLGRGEWETLAGSLSFTGQILWVERPKYAGNNTLRSTLIMFLVMAASAIPAALILAEHPANILKPFLNTPALVLFGFLVIICTLITFPLANHWQPKVSATQAGLLYCTEPVFTSCVCLFLPGLFERWWGLRYPNEQITWNLLAGGTLILGANIAIQLWPYRAKG